MMRASLVWLGIAVLAVINGALREAFLNRNLGERLGHLISTLILTAAVLLVSFATTSWIGATTLANGWAVGFGWLLATLCFEFLAGHFLFGNPWSKILADYNALKGRVWVMVPVCTLFGPPMAVQGLDPRWIVPYAISLVIAVCLLVFAFGRPSIARWSVALIFVWAGCYNLWLGATDPTEYINFANLAIVPAYRDFINGYFSTICGPMIMAIGVGQLLCGIAMALGGRVARWGVVGVVTFLTLIAPLGQGSAFPFSILVSLAAVVCLQGGVDG